MAVRKTDVFETIERINNSYGKGVVRAISILTDGTIYVGVQITGGEVKTLLARIVGKNSVRFRGRQAMIESNDFHFRYKHF